MKTISENEMMHSEEEMIFSEERGIEIPIQTLFDECLNFISVTDFDI